MFSRKAAILALATISVAFPVFGQTEPSTAPATRVFDSSQPVEAMSATVDMVTGNVQVQRTAGGAWEKAVVGMQLSEGTTIRTGLRSAIRCVIPPDQVFVLDRLTTITLGDALKQGNVVKTNLIMKYGRTQLEIAKAGLEHDAAITSPGATLAVRGTDIELENMPPFRTKATSFTGRAFFTAERLAAYVGSQGGARATINTGSSSAAEAALFSSVVDPRYAPARTPADARLIAQQVSLGGVLSFDQENQIAVIRGGNGPIRTESNLLTTLPGELDFVARWTGNADINLSIAVNYGSPGVTINLADKTPNEYIYPGFGLDQSPSGGRTDFDHRGGPKGGTEIVYWKTPLAEATYSVIVDRISGDPTSVTVNAFKKGVKLPIYSFFIDPFGPTVTPALTPGVLDLGDFQINYRDGKSTTFTYGVGTTATNRFGAGIVYDPISSLSDDPNSVKLLPDLNNGAAADITDPAQSAKVKKVDHVARLPKADGQLQSNTNKRPVLSQTTGRGISGPVLPRK